MIHADGGGGASRGARPASFSSLAALFGLAAATGLAGCAANTSFSDRIAGSSRVKGDADTVRVFQADSRAEAFPLAIGHCARFGRSAQFDAKRDGAYVFRCVKG